MFVAGTPDSITELPASTTAEFGNLSLPVNSYSASAADELKVLCPETCSENGGVGLVEIW